MKTIIKVEIVMKMLKILTMIVEKIMVRIGRSICSPIHRPTRQIERWRAVD